MFSTIECTIVEQCVALDCCTRVQVRVQHSVHSSATHCSTFECTLRRDSFILHVCDMTLFSEHDNRVQLTAQHSSQHQQLCVQLLSSVLHSSDTRCVASTATHCSTRLTIDCNTLLNNHSAQQEVDKLSSVLHSSVALDCTIQCKFERNTQHNRVQLTAQHSSATQCSTSTIECTIVEQCVALE